MINVSICLSDIDKTQIKESNGKKYLNITVAEKKEVDKYGNSHAVYITQSKEDRESKKDKKYIGSGKELKFNNNQQHQQQTKEQTNVEKYAQSIGNQNDLPF